MKNEHNDFFFTRDNVNGVFEDMQNWKKQHLEALTNPTNYEKGFLDIINGIENFVHQWEIKHDQKAKEDYFLSDCLSEMLDGFESLLNFERERLDGGLMSKKINALRDEWGVKD